MGLTLGNKVGVGKVRQGSNSAPPVLHPPIVSLPSQASIADVSATVGATLDCAGLSTVWSIEYGATTAYGSTQAGGTTSVNGVKTVGLTGLTELTTIHWRFKAVNADGTAYSDDQTLTTLLTSYQPKIQSIFGSSIISHFPINEASGTVMVDVINARNATYPSANPVTLYQDGYNGDKSGYWNGAARANIYNPTTFLNKEEGTIILWFKMSKAAYFSSNSDVLFDLRSTDTKNELRIQKNGINKEFSFLVKRNNISSSLQYSSPYCDGWVNFAATWSTSNDRIKTFVNGVPWRPFITKTGISIPIATAWDSILCGLGSARGGSLENPMTGNICHVTFLDKEVSDNEMLQLLPFNQVIFDGDSRTAANIYPHASCDVNVVAPVNVGISGYSVQNCIDHAVAQVDDRIRTGKKNICVIWAGVNSSGLTAQQIHDQLKTYCLARKSAGFKVIVCTEIDSREAVRITNGWPAKYLVLNDLIRADYTDFADSLADLGANINLQNADNTTYFVDKLHLTIAGNVEVAGMIAPHITALLS